MLRRDYILRLIEEAARLLAEAMDLIDKNDPENAEIMIRKTHELIKADPHWYDLKLTDLIRQMELAGFDYDQMEIVADLLNVESSLLEVKQQEDQAFQYLIKSIAILEYIDQYSPTFSFSRNQKINTLRDRLN